MLSFLLSTAWGGWGGSRLTVTWTFRGFSAVARASRDESGTALAMRLSSMLALAGDLGETGELGATTPAAPAAPAAPPAPPTPAPAAPVAPTTPPAPPASLAPAPAAAAPAAKSPGLWVACNFRAYAGCIFIEGVFSIYSIANSLPAKLFSFVPMRLPCFPYCYCSWGSTQPLRGTVWMRINCFRVPATCSLHVGAPWHESEPDPDR